MKKGFTLIELVVAVAIFVILLTFTGLIFKVSVGSYRLAGANAEIMRNLRAITDQLNSDFAGFQKDGYLIIQSEVIPNVYEFKDSPVTKDFRSDKIYYFSTGDFQSWFTTDCQSNMARICWGHDLTGRPANQWRLTRKVTLLIDQNVYDCNSVSFSEHKVLNEEPNAVLNSAIINTNSVNGIGELMCQNIGQFKIEWTDGTCLDTGGIKQLLWFGLDAPREVTNISYDVIENAVSTSFYRATWNPWTSKNLLPRAVKFTFTLYDSKGIIKNGRTFTHIVYIDRF